VSSGPDAPYPRRSLLWRVFSLNAAVMAVAALALLITPVTVGWPPSVEETGVILLGLVVALLADLALLRHALRSLRRLRRAMTHVDPVALGPRVEVVARSVDVADLNRSFNAMLDRLEAERRDRARHTQMAQEAERRWLSLELHDQIGQNLTALLLQLDVASRGAMGADERAAVEIARETARECLDHIRGLVTQLRPEALDDLGLRSALARLCERVTSTTGLDVQTSLSADFPNLPGEAQLAVYRVAQESLTNAVRHADAERAEVELTAVEGGLRLVVRDDGGGGRIEAGSGITGMRERALMVGGRLTIDRVASGGVEIRLDIPISEKATP